jgi:hypothetical protein
VQQAKVSKNWVLPYFHQTCQRNRFSTRYSHLTNF